MNLLELNIFRGSLFKQAKFLVTTPQTTQNAYYISEAGTISRELIPMHTGFMCPPTVKKAWVVAHSLKQTIFKNGLPAGGDTAFAISDRSYIPLTPNGTIKKIDIIKLTSLEEIAKKIHTEERAAAGGASIDSHTDAPHLVINICGILMGLLIVAAVIMYWKGG